MIVSNHRSSNKYNIVQSVMYNMEIYCTRPYCIENPYWIRRLRCLVQYGFSIQYRLVQYISILYITLYNNLVIFNISCFIQCTCIIIPEMRRLHTDSDIYFFLLEYNRKRIFSSMRID
jgi:hypothetical protein